MRVSAGSQEEHRRAYASHEEHRARYGAFQDSLKLAAQLGEADEGTAVFGVTRWSDRMNAEKALKCGSARQSMLARREDATETAGAGTPRSAYVWDGTCYAGKRFPHMCDGPLPTSVDWVALGAVAVVQDHGNCGNCFSFGATADFEVAWFLAGHPLIKLSEQQITSCDRQGDDAGCGGGGTNLDTDEWVTTNGIASEAAYPYCSGNHS